jgi:CrcB protein
MYICGWNNVNLPADALPIRDPVGRSAHLALHDRLLYQPGAMGMGSPDNRLPGADDSYRAPWGWAGRSHVVKSFAVVFLGAGIGGALRHGVNLAALRLLGPGFPHGTITVNIVGSLIMGLLAGWFAHRADPGMTWRLFLTTGVLGGFTTFSAFSLDGALLLERGQVVLAALYALSSPVLAILGLFAGLWLIRAMS